MRLGGIEEEKIEIGVAGKVIDIIIDEFTSEI
jgi:hypothetical protein